MHYKDGEIEAKQILESIGIKFDDRYHDDNSRNSMPDFKYLDIDRFIEVTHTKHNNDYFLHSNKFHKLKPGENFGAYNRRIIEIGDNCSRAFDRICNCDYVRGENGDLTPKSKEQYKKDCKLLKEHLGYDVTEFDYNKKFSEFNCDIPSFHFSIDNILREIVDDKGKKYLSGNTDLFIFAAIEEYRHLYDAINQNGFYKFIRFSLTPILKSPFHIIYVCAWDLHRQQYIIKDPQIIKFYKENFELKWEIYGNAPEYD